MSDLREGLLECFPPLPREIWWVPDNKLEFDEKDREFKEKRLVLVFSHALLGSLPKDSVYVVPISKSGYSDRLSRPIAKEVEKYYSSVQLNKKSFVFLNHPQPVCIKYFKEKICLVKIDFYQSILFDLELEILRKPTYDLSV